MIKYFKKDFILSNWCKIREILFLLLLFSHIMLRLYNTSWIVLGDIIPGFDVFTTHLENYGFPAIVIALYIINLIIDRSYFNIRPEAIKIVMFIVFALVSMEHITCLILGAFVLCADFSSIKKIAAVSAAAIVTGTLCVIIASKTGWTGDHLVPRMGRNAHYFGFYHYAVWARQIFYAVLFYFVSKVKKLTLVDIALFALIQAVVFYYSTQRLTFVVSILATVILIVFVKYEIIKINNKFISGLALIAFPVAMGVSVWSSLAFDFDKVIWNKINVMINGRLWMQNLAFKTFDIKLFGQQVHHVTEANIALDNGYMYSLYGFGLIATIITILVFSYILWRSCKKNDTVLFSLFIIMMVYLLVDGPMYDLSFIAVVFLFFPILLKDQMKEKNII